MMPIVVALMLSQAPAPRRYPAGDGCNTCTDLGNGFASCTLLACQQSPVIKALDVSPAPADAPLADPDAPGRSVVLEAGDPTPFKGVCLDVQEDVHRARREDRLSVKVKEYEAPDKLILTKPAFAAILVGVAVIVGGGVAIGFAVAQHH